MFCKLMCLGSLDVMDTRLRFGLNGFESLKIQNLFLIQNTQTGSYSMVPEIIPEGKSVGELC